MHPNIHPLVAFIPVLHCGIIFCVVVIHKCVDPSDSIKREDEEGMTVPFGGSNRTVNTDETIGMENTNNQNNIIFCPRLVFLGF